MIEIQQSSLFDYSALDNETRASILQLEDELDCVLKRSQEEIGHILLRVKQCLPHGQYMPWLASKGISESTAWRCMQIAQGKEIKKSFIMKDLPVAPIEPPAILSAIPEQQQPEPEHITLHIDGQVFAEALKPYLPPEPVAQEQIAISRGVPAALQSSESNEWFTPREYVDAARELMGGIDIDPASNEFANQVVQATRYFTKRDNGLMQSWHGRVWLNPPYGFDVGISNQETWSHQLIERYRAGLVTEAVLLVNANTEAKWFQPLYDYLICLTNHRIRFYNTSGDASQPTQGNALVYFGNQRNRFIELFSKFGTVIERAK